MLTLLRVGVGVGVGVGEKVGDGRKNYPQAQTPIPPAHTHQFMGEKVV